MSQSGKKISAWFLVKRFFKKPADLSTELYSKNHCSKVYLKSNVSILLPFPFLLLISLPPVEVPFLCKTLLYPLVVLVSLGNCK